MDHGWCAQASWINTILESLKTQGHYRGGVHPNTPGYGKIGSELASAIKMKLLDSGLPSTQCTEPLPSAVCAGTCGGL